MGKGEDKKKNNPAGRRIRQVYISEDGSSKETVTTKVIRQPEEPEEEKHDRDRHERNEERDTSHHHAHEELSSGTKAIRVAAIAVTIFCSLLLAMAVGVGLALWDSNRTMADLRVALFAQDVSAATAESVPQIEESEESGETEEDADELDSVPGGDEPDYGSTLIADDERSGNVSKAGSGDEITKEEKQEDTGEPLDPIEDYPIPFSTVDESYFTDALFIGDSRLQGFGFWSGLPATYYCATGFQLYKYDTANVVQTENGKVPIFEAMPYDAFTKIYIKVGLNELGYGTEENFEKYYAQLIADLREHEPRAVIYVHAILPVTAAKSGSDKAHNNPNIVARNASLEKFAKEQKAYFLDAGPVLSDEEGNLKPEMTSDGIHLKPEYMKIWREYLCEHAVVVNTPAKDSSAAESNAETVTGNSDENDNGNDNGNENETEADNDNSDVREE